MVNLDQKVVVRHFECHPKEVLKVVHIIKKEPLKPRSALMTEYYALDGY